MPSSPSFANKVMPALQEAEAARTGHRRGLSVRAVHM